MRRWQVWFFGRPGQGLFWLAVVLVGVVLVTAGPGRARWWWPFQRAAPAVLVAPTSASVPSDGWTAVAKAAMPAVVNVASARTVRGPEGPSAPFFSDPFFRFFPGPESAPRRERSLGSGVVVTPDGYVLTNNHIVEGARDIRVTLADRRELPAKLVGADPKTDLAVLKLTGSGFPVVALGDSSRVAVAEVVLAIGSPFGLSQTVTMGIVRPAAALADKLATGTWTHDYPIMAEEGKALGLPVSTEMPEEVYQFMALFPQPTRTRPAVEYIPMPYRGRQGQARSGS